MFRFSLFPVRGILVFGMLLALLLLHLPTTVQARSPYEMTIATEGDPGDGVLDRAEPDELRSADEEGQVSGQSVVESRPMRRCLMPSFLYLGPTNPVWMVLPAPWSFLELRPDLGAPSADRGW